MTNRSKKYSTLNKVVNIDCAKYLIIVESPSKCKKITEYLGLDYACISSIGHIRRINGLKSIDTKGKYNINFDLISEKKRHISEMKTIINKFETHNIILGSDNDREGEAIAWHVCEVFNLPVDTTKRIIFNEITKSALSNAITNPTTINMKLVNSQHARQVIDLIVGFKISPFLWKYLYHDKENSLSAGRCQTPALRLIYENDILLSNNSNYKKEHKISGTFFEDELLFTVSKSLTTDEESIQFLTEMKTFENKLSITDETSHIRRPPQPFSTSRLLQSTNQVLHMSPHETMSICQQLYQDGFITYMRTESNTYSKTFLDKMKDYLIKTYSDNSNCIPVSWTHIEHNKSIHPHEAIRITDVNVCKIQTTNVRLQSVYNIIRKNTIESCMREYKYNCCKVILSAPMKLKYERNIDIPIQLGWTQYSEKKTLCELQQVSKALILRFKSYRSSNIPYIRVNINTHCKGNGSHYSEASLINKLDELGIGRPSTFSTIVKTIQDRHYVERCDIQGINVSTVDFMLEKDTIHKIDNTKEFGQEKNKLKITDLGRIVMPFLIKYFDNLFSYDYTEYMEKKLDEVVNGSQLNWYDICNECENEVSSNSTHINKIKKNFFPLEDNYDVVFEKYGPCIRHHKEDGSIDFLNIKKGTDFTINNIQNNKYKVEDIIERPTEHIGIWNNEKVFIKDGRFGRYLEYGNIRTPTKDITKSIDHITWDDILPVLENKQPDMNVLRYYNESTSLRKGKYGPYIYYKTMSMNKPSFFSIKKYKGDCFHDDIEDILRWVKTTFIDR